MELPIVKQTDITEAFVMTFEKAAGGFNLIMAWDDVLVSLPVKL